MNSTFIQLVNRVCERINETTLEEHQFNSVKNIHASIKNSVQDAVYIILQEESAWPFLAIQQTIVLDEGTNEYAWPSDFDTVDWDSFSLKIEDGNYRNLRPAQKEIWYSKGMSMDYSNLPKGMSSPEYVFSTHGRGFGISPNPDKDYELTYRYWRTTYRLEDANDECRIPSQYEYVIVACSLSLMYSFLDNSDRASFWESKYKQGLQAMKRTLLGTNYEFMHNGMLRR